MGGYVQISRIAGALLKMAVKVWAYTGLVTFFCFLVYYMYGGAFASVVLLFSGLGKVITTEIVVLCCVLKTCVLYLFTS